MLRSSPPNSAIIRSLPQSSNRADTIASLRYAPFGVTAFVAHRMGCLSALLPQCGAFIGPLKSFQERNPESARSRKPQRAIPWHRRRLRGSLPPRVLHPPPGHLHNRQRRESAPGNGSAQIQRLAAGMAAIPLSIPSSPVAHISSFFALTRPGFSGSPLMRLLT
jgi:hypothetical protein